MLVGRNARENDRITREMSGCHYWFHADGVPGSHVILQEKCPSTQMILEAAKLAAKHSKAAGSVVKVVYARGVDVNKPKGAAPGTVTCDNPRYIYVEN
jgi:predicted ribosome quality control (RQC) complex YloA/Tae2 family protein